MKQAQFLLLNLMLAGCATTNSQRFTVGVPSAGWTQVINIPPASTTDGRQPLLFLRNLATGAEITADAYDLGDKPVAEMAELIWEKLHQGNVTCAPIEDDGRVAGFKTTLFRKSGDIWRGKIAVLRVTGAPASTVFIIAGYWPSEYDLTIAAEFDAIVATSAVE